ncbi:S8 family serine peptidase [Streptomyces sp. NPDC052051]|uniref:S8 family peptidase n=1 Tax=Streptomyces sp. NPDC052051 TaxID=3154649 RepID=UPI00343E9242
MPNSARGRSRRRLLSTSVAVALGTMIAGLPAAGAVQAATGTPTGTASQLVGATEQHKPRSVTLITGDKVTLTQGPDGKRAVTVTPAPGTVKTYRTLTTPDGDLYVYPSDSVAGIAAQTLDRNLFNVTRLLADGQADGSADRVPVIVEYADKASRATLTRRAKDLPSGKPGVVLERLDMAAVRVEKKGAAGFWHAVTPALTKKNAAARSSSATGPVAKIWYDAKAKVALDQSVPQIGAPAAWAAGLDGKGTKVAVLDTGVDTTHPDLKNRIGATRSFLTGVDTVTDGHGHGTHVASTVAGTGAASDGRLKGVAPGAELMIGKVLDDAGSGPISGIIAGMEWAVDQGADVVSMSLGSAASTGSDPTREAVDRLSASSDTLFVVAAGNSGPGESTLDSPGTADSALTVGAVDKSDHMAEFSSRGPRVGDSGLKPDLTAPGVGIVAARAAGTAMGTVVDEHYTSANGTSMATPHVAGAAALLKERYPDWTGEQLKAALVSHTQQGDTTVYDQGSGRTAVDASLDASVDIEGNVDFGFLDFDPKNAPEPRTLTLRNRSDKAVTVSLAAEAMSESGKELPAGALTFAAPEVTVAAHGTAQAKVTLDPAEAEPGVYSGAVTASADGAAVAHTAVGFTRDTERFDLTVRLKDRHGGTASSADVLVMGLDNDTFEPRTVSGVTSETFRVASGRYAVLGSVATGTSGFPLDYEFYRTHEATDLYDLDDVTVARAATEVSVDASQAVDVKAKVADEKRPLERSALDYEVTRINEKRMGTTYSVMAYPSSSDEVFGVIPSAAPRTGTSAVSFFERNTQPVLTADVKGAHGFPLTVRTAPDLARFSGTKNLAVVDAGTASPADLAKVDVKGKAALVRHDDPVHIGNRLEALKDAGAAAVVLLPVPDAPYNVYTATSSLPVFATGASDGAALAQRVSQGATTITLHGREHSAYAYSGQWSFEKGIPENPSLTAHKRDFATLHNSVYGDDGPSKAWYSLSSWSPLFPLSIRPWQQVRRGVTYDEYVYAADSRQQFLQMMAPGEEPWLFELETPKTYRPGQVVDGTWFAGPLTPAPLGSRTPCVFCRTGDTFLLYTAPHDSEPDHVLSDSFSSGTWEAYRDGEPIDVFMGIADGVPEKADYRFVTKFAYDSANAVEGIRHSTDITTDYRFTSQATTDQAADCGISDMEYCAYEAVINPGYDLRLDLLNRAQANKPYSFTLDADRPEGWKGSTATSGAKVSVSYDGGTTWQRTEVKRLDQDSFRVSYRHPKLASTDGYVAVKAELWDDHGSRTLQSIEKAYALR